MKSLADTQNWDALEDAWLEGLEADPVPVADLLDAAESVARHDRRRATELLALLAAELLPRGEHVQAATVLRRAVQLAPGNAELRNLVLRLVRERSPDQRESERLISFAGLDNRPLLEAWDLVDSMGALRAGSYVVHDTWGPGKVIEFETMTEEVVVNFAARKSHRMSWSMALKALRPLPADHLQAISVDRPDELAAMSPVALLGLAVQSLGGDADPKDIRRLIEPLVGAHAWAGWWARARAGAKGDARLHFSLAKPVRVRWVATEDGQAAPPDQLAELAALPAPELVRAALRIARDTGSPDAVRDILRNRIPSLRRTPPLHLEALLVLRELRDPSAETEARLALEATADPIEIALAVRSADLRRGAMSLAQELGEPVRLRRELFLRSSNPADWEDLHRQMSEQEKSELGWDVHRGLPAYATAYFWLVRKAEEGFPLPGTPLERTMRLVDLLDEAAGMVGPVTSYVAEGHVLQNAVPDGDSDKAETLLEFIDTARLPVSLKDEIRADVYARFPSLKPTQDIIYATAVGLQKRADELRHLMEVELPENKRALADAKAHGDLRENFEYKAAKEQQERILARISEIDHEISRSRLLSAETVDTASVSPGCRIDLLDAGGSTHTVLILGPWDSDPDRGVFSHRAPGISPLLGRRVGETVTLGLPGLSGAFQITSIEYGAP